MIFGRIRGFEAKDLGNIGAGRRKSGRLQEIPDQLQYFSLACGEMFH